MSEAVKRTLQAALDEARENVNNAELDLADAEAAVGRAKWRVRINQAAVDELAAHMRANGWEPPPAKGT